MFKKDTILRCNVFDILLFSRDNFAVYSFLNRTYHCFQSSYKTQFPRFKNTNTHIELYSEKNRINQSLFAHRIIPKNYFSLPHVTVVVSSKNEQI